MATNKFLPGCRSLTSHTESGMIHSILSPFPNEFQVLFTDFLDLNRIPKATVTDKAFNIAQILNFFKYHSTTNTKTDTPMFNMGINSLDQLYIKLQNQGDQLTDPTPPSILIDVNGDVYLNGQSSTTQTGYLYVFDTNYGTPAPGLRNNALLDVNGDWRDPVNPANFRYDNIFAGAGLPGPGQSWDWNPVITPQLPIPNNQSVVNTSAFPGSVEPGFQTFVAAGVKLPVDCNISGKFVPNNAPPSYIGGALLDDGSGPIVHTYDFTATPEFTANYTFSVGIVRRINGGAGAIFDVVAQHDMSVPFRHKYTGTAISFSVDFQFEMENTDPASGNPQDYMPFFNHNGIELPNTDGILRYDYVRVSFTTKNNV